MGKWSKSPPESPSWNAPRWELALAGACTRFGRWKPSSPRKGDVQGQMWMRHVWRSLEGPSLPGSALLHMQHSDQSSRTRLPTTFLPERAPFGGCTSLHVLIDLVTLCWSQCSLLLPSSIIRKEAENWWIKDPTSEMWKRMKPKESRKKMRWSGTFQNIPYFLLLGSFWVYFLTSFEVPSSHALAKIMWTEAKCFSPGQRHVNASERSHSTFSPWYNDYRSVCHEEDTYSPAQMSRSSLLAHTGQDVYARSNPLVWEVY